MECDVLAGERGPSYTRIEQIKSLKLLHVRFYFASKTTSHLVMDQEDEADGDDSIPATSFQSKKPKSEWSVPVQKSPMKVTVGSAYPKCKIIPLKCNQDIIELHVEEFYIDHAYTI